MVFFLFPPGAGAVQHHRQEQHLVPRAPLGVDICGANFWKQKQKLRFIMFLSSSCMILRIGGRGCYNDNI